MQLADDPLPPLVAVDAHAVSTISMVADVASALIP